MPEIRRRNPALYMVVAMALWACQAPVVNPSPTAAVEQRHECGNLRFEICEEVIALVTRQVPAMARSPVAVTATLDPNRPTQRGGDLEVLVAFAPFDLTDYAFSPPTWIVTQGMLSPDWRVEPWRSGPLPAHFTTLLNVAGIPT